MKTITGSWANAWGGTLKLQLNKYALIHGKSDNAPRFYVSQLDQNGAIPIGFEIWANDELMPEGSLYRLIVLDDLGGILIGPQWISICGTPPIDLNQFQLVAPSPPSTIPVTISPGSATLAPGETQQFTANQSVTWTASLGTIGAGGLYVAPSVATATIVTVTATSTTDPSQSASVSVSIQPGTVVIVTLAPQQVTLISGDTQQFTATVTGTANIAVVFSATQGSITSAGFYTAPSVTSTTTATITAVSVANPSSVGQASVTINPTQTVHVSIAPLSPSINSGGTQQFTQTVTGSANTAVTWSTSAGTISSTGLFTAPTVSVNTSVTVTATSQADSLAVAHVSFTVHPAAAITVTISPTSATLISGATQTFTAIVSNTTNHNVTWSASSGSITTAGVFTAPSVSATTTATVTATSQADTTKKAQVSVTVNPAIVVTVTPSSVTLTAGKTQQFSHSVSGTTNQNVTWSESPSTGTISSAGLYTAPATVSATATVTITATSAADTTKKGTAAVTLNPTVTGQLDLLNWVLLSQRATQHLVGDPSAPYHVDWIDTDAGYPANFPKGIFWYVKNKLGNPWDVCRYDANYALSHWITENGDSQYTAQCQAANGTTCWLYARAYKRNTTTGGIHILPRHFTPGSTITINNPTPNNVVRTADCEASTTTINLGPVKSITTGPFNISWGGSIDKGSGTLANGPNYDNVHGVPTIKNQYCFTVDTSQAIGYASVEETYYVQGFGRVAWYYYVRGVYQQKTVNTTLASGGHPALNFPCGPGKSWFV